MFLKVIDKAVSGLKLLDELRRQYNYADEMFEATGDKYWEGAKDALNHFIQDLVKILN